MSANNKLLVRVSPSFKTNTQKLINELYGHGLRDDVTLSEYVREAVEEKRKRDKERINKASLNSDQNSISHC